MRLLYLPFDLGIGQVSTCTGCYQLPIFHCSNVHPEDPLTHILGAPYIDDVMSYNSLKTILYTFWYYSMHTNVHFKNGRLQFRFFLFQTLSVLGQEQFSAALPQRAPVRWRHNTPLNTVVMFVPQQEAWVVERMGKFHRVLEPGVNVLVPVLDRVKYVQSLKEIAIDIPQQSAITIGELISHLGMFLS